MQPARELGTEMDKWLTDPDSDANLSSDLYASGLQRPAG
jgi:hypothetical protein